MSDNQKEITDNPKDRIKKALSADKSRTVFIIIALIAIIVIFFSSQFKEDNTKKLDSQFSTEQYKTTLEQQVYNMVTQVEGVGEVQVMLTLQNSYEYVYLDDGKTLQKINEPTIRGVVVVCEGGESAVVKEEISSLLTTVLDIPSTKVCISKLK